MGNSSLQENSTKLSQLDVNNFHTPPTASILLGSNTGLELGGRRSTWKFIILPWDSSTHVFKVLSWSLAPQKSDHSFSATLQQYPSLQLSQERIWHMCQVEGWPDTTKAFSRHLRILPGIAFCVNNISRDPVIDKYHLSMSVITRALYYWKVRQIFTSLATLFSPAHTEKIHTHTFDLSHFKIVIFIHALWGFQKCLTFLNATNLNVSCWGWSLFMKLVKMMFYDFSYMHFTSIILGYNFAWKWVI